MAICSYGNNLSEVQMFYQVIPRSKMVDDYDVNSKMSFEQIEVEDKPLFVKQAWAAHLTMGFR